ncbi:MAG: cupredoxin domain-containing protein [Betaproteobacteria bacterium]|nr:cupredoxin domain-containing protein [Betaproteobacteria bacterium]MDE2423869.1 cupredoxin domain-containing protein [Betaproteobacteria bacterium]
MKTMTLLLSLGLTAYLVTAQAQDSYTLTITDHGVEPQTLVVPAGVKIPLAVVNRTSGPIELEGKAFNSEMVAPPNGQTKGYIGPLQAGDYAFYNDYNRQMTGMIRSH